MFTTYVSQDQFGVPVVYVRRDKGFISRKEVEEIARDLEGKLNDEAWLAERAEERWQGRDAA